jgi:hypothetical protein
LSGYGRNLKKECAGLVAGQAVLTAESRMANSARQPPSQPLSDRLLAFPARDYDFQAFAEAAGPDLVVGWTAARESDSRMRAGHWPLRTPPRSGGMAMKSCVM